MEDVRRHPATRTARRRVRKKSMTKSPSLALLLLLLLLPSMVLGLCGRRAVCVVWWSDEGHAASFSRSLDIMGEGGESPRPAHFYRAWYPKKMAKDV